MIGLLRALLLLALAGYVLGRSRTRGPGGLALVTSTAGAIIGIELSGLAWSNLIESLTYGLAGLIVILEPAWLVVHSGFAREFQRVDREAWQASL